MSVTDHLSHAVLIDEYPDYAVCPCGLIISFKSNNPKILVSFPRGKYGYTAVNLCMYGKFKTITVSRLVASAFLDPQAKVKIAYYIKTIIQQIAQPTISNGVQMPKIALKWWPEIDNLVVLTDPWQNLTNIKFSKFASWPQKFLKPV